MSRAGVEPSHEGAGELPERATVWMKSLRYSANEVASGLRVAWRVGPEADKRGEAIALFSAVVLYQQCRRTLGALEFPLAPEPDLLTAISPIAKVDTRYEIEAALRTIPEVAPQVVQSDMYGAIGRLPDFRSVGLNEWSDQLREHHPEVVDEWHDWIWSSHRDEGASVRHEELSDEALRDYGDSSLLALAAGRLSTGLTAVLDGSRPSE